MPRAPVSRIARFAGTAIARHRAEKRNFARLRFEIGERRFQGLGRRSHERMMKWMIHPNESRKHALRLQFRRHRLKRNARTGERDRTRPIEGGNRHCSIMPGDQRRGFILGQSNREHRPFPATARFHETRPQSDNPRGFFKWNDAGDACGRDLTHAMPHNGRGFERPRISRAPRALPAWQKWPAAQSPCATSGTSLRSGRVLREGRNCAQRRQRGVTALDRLAKDRLVLASNRDPFPTIAAPARS